MKQQTLTMDADCVESFEPHRRVTPGQVIQAAEVIDASFKRGLPRS